jgi:hypothetical protein
VLRKGKAIQLYLVTTLDLPVEQIVELYGFRWNIELDLRSLKQTVHLHTLRSTTTAMVAKELVLGVTAYNFVRAAIYAAARAANLNPRRISFSRAQDVVNDHRDELQYLTNHDASHSSYRWPRSWQDDAAGEACLDGARDSGRERAGDHRREAGVWSVSTPKPVRIRAPNPGPRYREVRSSAANIRMGLF